MKLRSGLLVNRNPNVLFHKWNRLPDDLNMFIVTEFLCLPTTVALSATGKRMLNWLKDTYAAGHFKSHGFDQHIYHSFKAANWVVDKGINLRVFKIIVQLPNGAPGAQKWVVDKAKVLNRAIIDGEVTIVKLMLRCGFLSSGDINKPAFDCCALHTAVVAGNLEITNALLQDSRVDDSLCSLRSRALKDVLQEIHGMRIFNEYMRQSYLLSVTETSFEQQLACVEALLQHERARCTEEERKRTVDILKYSVHEEFVDTDDDDEDDDEDDESLYDMDDFDEAGFEMMGDGILLHVAPHFHLPQQFIQQVVQFVQMHMNGNVPGGHAENA